MLALFGLCLLTSLVLSLVGATTQFTGSSSGGIGAGLRDDFDDAADSDVLSSGPKKPASTRRRATATAALLQEKVRLASGAHSVVCAALFPPPRGSGAAPYYGAHGGGYNYSFASSTGAGLAGGSSRPPQYCCLVPPRASIKKAKPAVPAYTPSTHAASSDSGGLTRAALLLTAETAGDARAQAGAAAAKRSKRRVQGDNEGAGSDGGVVTGADGSQWTLGPPSAWQWTCLPSFVIAGTQKSGSTALAAFLLDHPQVEWKKKDERKRERGAHLLVRKTLTG
jgi:hypothetical protein